MKEPADIFAKLAADVERTWLAAGSKLDAFAPIATDVLSGFKYDLTQDQLDLHLANWFATSKEIPEQINVHNTFGQPPVTVFNNGRFVVDLYFWLGCDTSIHSHGFRGAFKVLHGKSLHETFAVTVTDQIASDVALTRLATPSVELLSAGDIRTISPGAELTHRVIHLEEPTITLCVKTINERGLSQWHHFTNGLAIKKRHLDPALIKQLYYFQYLSGQNGRTANDFINQVIDRQDISTLMNLCEEVSSGGYAIESEIVNFVLEKIYARYAGTEWFGRYENSAEVHEAEIFLSRSPSPEARLAAHFANAGFSYAVAAPLICDVAGKSLSKKEIEQLIVSLLDPEHSHAETQIERMRTFLSE